MEIDDNLIRQWEPKITRMTSTYNRTLATKSQRNLNNEASYLGEIFASNESSDDSPLSNLSKESFLEDKKDWLNLVEVQDLLSSLKLTKPELTFLALRQAGHSIKEIHLRFEKAYPENSLASVREHVKQKFLGRNLP